MHTLRRVVVTLTACVVFGTSFLTAGAQTPRNVPRRHHAQVRLITTPTRLVTAVVVGQHDNPGLGDFVFCVAHAKPVAEPLTWSGPATVVYEAMGQIPGFQPAPEQLGIGSGVAVLPDEGAGWLFEGNGLKAPVGAEDQPKAANARRLTSRIRMAPTKPARLSFCANVPVGG